MAFVHPYLSSLGTPQCEYCGTALAFDPAAPLDPSSLQGLDIGGSAPEGERPSGYLIECPSGRRLAFHDPCWREIAAALAFTQLPGRLSTKRPGCGVH